MKRSAFAIRKASSRRPARCVKYYSPKNLGWYITILPKGGVPPPVGYPLRLASLGIEPPAPVGEPSCSRASRPMTNPRGGLDARPGTLPALPGWGLFVPPRLDASLESFFIQRMKTKWGSSNPLKRTVRLNLELAKYPPDCLDYVTLHEIAHFIVPNHNECFRGLLDSNMPGWRSIRDRLNEGPLTAID